MGAYSVLNPGVQALILRHIFRLSVVLWLGFVSQAGAQTIEVWLDAGEIQLIHEDGTVTRLEAGEYSRCAGPRCEIKLFENAPSRPSPPGQGRRADRLPPRVAAALRNAATPEDVAALIADNFALAGALMREAAVLGLASPGEIVVVLAPGLTPSDFAALISSAAMAAPAEADAIAAAAMSVPGADAPKIARALVKGLEASGHPPQALSAEIGEIVLALGGARPGEGGRIARAIADATSNPDDSAASIRAAAAQAIETGAVPDQGPPQQGPAGGPTFQSLPNETQNNPSGN